MKSLGNPLRQFPLLGLLLLLVAGPHQSQGVDLRQPAIARPPAVPLVVHDPYFSIWSATDSLHAGTTLHWTLQPQPLSLLIRVDGQCSRLMGLDPEAVPPLGQDRLEITPTQTRYAFSDAQVRVELGFRTPALPTDLDLLSRPVTFITTRVTSLDGQPHEVALLFAANALAAVHQPGQLVVAQHGGEGNPWARVGSLDQPTLQRKGDATRIDWGFLYLATGQRNAVVSAAPTPELFRSFIEKGSLPTRLDSKPLPAAADGPALAALVPLGTIQDRPGESTILLAYDDQYSIDWMGEQLRPFWARNGATIESVLIDSWRDREEIAIRCDAFDRELGAALTEAGGPVYAHIGALAHRQSLAGGKLVADPAGGPLYFSKENTSNGCIGTADVFYPQLPHFLLLNPTLAKASLIPMLEYAASPRWKFPFAPHDLGTYPAATGQVYGGGERTEENQMPVEESGNMLLLMAAVAQVDGNADFAAPYWPLLGKWAQYCERDGFDPANQLCTDDFAGHLARNVNLSAKAILGLAAYGRLAAIRGESQLAETTLTRARELARRWMEMADAGDHYRLTFDPGDTWSQKYNLVWDQILGLDVFPPEVRQKELAYYQKVANRYGVPLDSRKDFTKSDWLVWTASMTTDRDSFIRFVEPLAKFLDESPDRVPFSDWYDTVTGRVTGFHARPVVGGVFIRLLTTPDSWRAWAARAPRNQFQWAPIPVPPTLNTVLPTARDSNALWRYTTDKPTGEWSATSYDDAAWKQGAGGFGSPETPGAEVRTTWNTPEIWLRREINLGAIPEGEIRLLLHHDEDAEVYLDGLLAARVSGFTTDYVPVRLTPEARARLKPGNHTIAVHCRQTGGGQFIDLGLAVLEPARSPAP